MKHYLSNTDKSITTKHKVEAAAKASGQDVRYELGPMPPNPASAGTYYYRAYHAGDLNNLDCIVGYDAKEANPNGDYSKFWEAYANAKT